MLRSLLSGYSALEGRYDELLSGPGKPRPQWDGFLQSLAAPPPCRFDVVAIDGEHLQWLRAAFDTG